MKKKAISILLGLCIMSLAGCGAVATGMETGTVSNRLPAQVVELADRDGDEDPDASKDAQESGQDEDDQDGQESEGKKDRKYQGKEKQRVTDPATQAEIEEHIESVGLSYDGLESYDMPSVDSILLETDIMAVSGENFQGASRADKKAIEEYLDLVEQFRSYFTQIKVYEPKEGYTIAISNKKLYEYKVEDTYDILLAYEKAEQARQNVPMVMTDDTLSYSRGRSSKGILGGISNFISGKSSAKMAESACESACESAGVETADECYAVAPSPAPQAAAADYAFEAEDASSTECYPMPVDPQQEWNTEEYKSFVENRFMSTTASPFSTFGMDVDTASFSNFRKKIFNDKDIPRDSIRTEEMMNYFDYDYVTPENGDKFGVTVEISDTPWNEDTQLLRVGVKSEEANVDNVSSNVVFLIDTSGSMFDADKLPLVQKSFLMLLHNLDRHDRVSIVTYAGSDEIKCEGIPCNKKEKITEEILSLEAWGGTNGAAGITTAYNLARKNFIKDGNNRVILATDGDLNLGITSESDLVELIQEEKESGVFLSVLGVGTGNYKDSKMKALADNGNGNFAYIDSTSAANKALLKDFNSLMYTVAKDAKMQVEFNPAKVKGYRQIGYELRQLNAEDFADDTKDGAEIGSGRCVTVLYEIALADSDQEIPGVESKYGNSGAGDDETDELLTVSIRYKEPDADKSQLIEVPVTAGQYSHEMSDDMSWAAGVAEVSQILRNSEYKGTSTYKEVYNRLKNDQRIMTDDDRAQFMFMVDLLQSGGIGVTDEDDGYYW
ncbi:MAG: von Willebrand factor type A domain-containing protein [Lachnospiraceae bacterium]|nr:von Willebrand factor type A domain-containing protein [Lachnospiraceae bacterium]